MITQAELPINNRGAVYHLDLLPDELADIVITVGAPERVSQVSHFFDKIEVKRAHREFICHTGYLGSRRLSVISTGIGMPNIDIVMNELDALVNINLKTKTIIPTKRELKIIRLGTTGGITDNCSPGDIVISRYAIGFDTLVNYYEYAMTPQLQKMEQELIEHLKGVSGPFYVSESCSKFAKEFSSLGELGITATCIGFYGPQGRRLRLPLKYPEFINTLKRFESNNYPVINLEMETAAIYALGSILDHRCLSLSVVLGNRIKGTFVADVKTCLDSLIRQSLEIIARM